MACPASACSGTDMCDMQERFANTTPEYQDHLHTGGGPAIDIDLTESENRQIAFYSKCLKEIEMNKKFRNTLLAVAIGPLLAGIGPMPHDAVEPARPTKRKPSAPQASSGLHKDHTANEYRRQAVANSVNGCGPRIRRARDAWIKKIEEETGRRLTKAERGKAIENFNALKPYQGAL